MDPSFTGEPNYTPLAEKNQTTAGPIDGLTEKPTPTDASSALASSTVSQSDDTVAGRPTRVKPSVSDITTATAGSNDDNHNPKETQTTGSVSPAAQASSDEEGGNESGSGTSTIIYALVGSGAIITLAGGMYVQKRKGWRSPVLASTENAPEDGRLAGYEFQVLRNSEEQEEDGDERPLLTEEESRRNNAST